MITQSELHSTKTTRVKITDAPAITHRSCGRSMYALAFVIPATMTAALYLPDATKTGNCAIAVVPALLAGTTAFALYKTCKLIKHKFIKHEH